MMPVITTVAELADLQSKLAFTRGHHVFRGQASCDWKLECTLSRLISSPHEIETYWDAFLDAHNEFVSRMSPIFEKFRANMVDKDFFYLSCERHLDMPSIFLDWSARLDFAVKCACESEPDKDGALFVMLGKIGFNKRPIKESPFSWTETKILCKDFDFINGDRLILEAPLPRIRRFRQVGFFSVIAKQDLCTPYTQLFQDANCILLKYIIPAQAKSELLDHVLSKYPANYYCLKDYGNTPEIKIARELTNKYFYKQ